MNLKSLLYVKFVEGHEKYRENVLIHMMLAFILTLSLKKLFALLKFLSLFLFIYCNTLQPQGANTQYEYNR